MTRNPFGVPDVPDPDGDDVAAFAMRVTLSGSATDDNAQPWFEPSVDVPASIEGDWSSRWNATGIEWQTGRGAVRQVRDRVYLLFHWDGATKHGLIEARPDGGDRLVGRYLNLSAPDITRPWVGLIVDRQRIDGQHSEGRIDFRR